MEMHGDQIMHEMTSK